MTKETIDKQTLIQLFEAYGGAIIQAMKVYEESLIPGKEALPAIAQVEKACAAVSLAAKAYGEAIEEAEKGGDNG